MGDRQALEQLKDILRLILCNRGKGRVVTFSDADIEAVSAGIRALEHILNMEDDGK